MASPQSLAKFNGSTSGKARNYRWDTQSSAIPEPSTYSSGNPKLADARAEEDD